MNSEELGPFAYENWKLSLAGKPLQAVREYPIFTDAHILGEVRDRYGPYQLLNTVPNPPNLGFLAPTIILRVESYIDTDDRPSMESTNFDRYHGGLLSDEIASLISLCMGVRAKAGGATRDFSPGDDPKGRPINWFLHQNPILIKSLKSGPKGITLPSAVGPHNLEQTYLLRKLTKMSSPGAIALIRAARLYQDAIWVIESEPELSWLLLVSAIEIAAGHWSQAKYDEIEALKEEKPELASFLEEAGGQEVVRRVAHEFANLFRAAKKFRKFIVNFLPEPPSERPDKTFLRVSWKTQDMNNAMVKIYSHRSRALHAGIPFPMPMCEPLSAMKEERPFGLAASAYGGVWLAKDMPMLLHVFEYIVRSSLLKWWESMVSDEENEQLQPAN